MFSLRMLRSSILILTLAAIAVNRGVRGTGSDDPLPQVSLHHPRIYVRNDAARAGRGLTVGDLRKRLPQPVYSRWHHPIPGENLNSAVERAARYLESRSQEDIEFARRYLLSHTFSQREHDVGGLLAGAEMATAFDWIYDGLADSDRAAIMSNIVTTADSSFDFLIHGEPDVNHNYTYMALRTIAICGLALSGETGRFDKRAQEYLELARLWIEGPGKVLDTWKAREGAWAEGSHYTFHETVRTLIMMLHAYRTATNTDYLALIEKKHGNFIAGVGRFLIACTRPDLTLERIGDVLPSRALAAITVPLTAEMLASGLSDASERARLRSFAAELREAYGEKALHPSFDWGMRIFFDAHAPISPSYRTLPLAMRLGAGSDEHVVFRNGWNQDSTLITILAGNHYTDHQHFDKGHFLIYNGGGLVVDSGAYDDMYKPDQHWNNYATRTLAHNCLLVFDPRASLPGGYANEGGQIILRGMQHHADWRTFLAHQELEGLQASRVQTFVEDQNRRFDYLQCDLTNAYRDRVELYERHFVYLLDSNYLVVFDRVRAKQPEFKKRWLLHFQERPTIDGADPAPGVSKYDGANLIEARRGDAFALGGRTVSYDGVLLIHPLLPERRTITIVGGPGFEYFNGFNGTNYPPRIADRANAPREAGAWRMELAPAPTSRDDLFLNALQIADQSARDKAAVRLLEDPSGKSVGAQFVTSKECRIVLFSKSLEGAPIALPLSYEVDSAAAARHLLLELPPHQKVTITIGGRRVAPGEISEQGILSFEDHSKGKRTIEIRHR